MGEQRTIVGQPGFGERCLLSHPTHALRWTASTTNVRTMPPNNALQPTQPRYARPGGRAAIALGRCLAS
jgi:hypothetical protein